MAKTAKQVQGDIIQLLQDSTLYAQTSGKIYRNGYRPSDSVSEDMIVTHTAGIPSQLQTGVVTINIYVNDIVTSLNGNTQRVEDGARTAQIEALAQEWASEIIFSSSPYAFELQKTIYTEKDADINQHFVVVKLEYQLFNI